MRTHYLSITLAFATHMTGAARPCAAQNPAENIPVQSAAEFNATLDALELVEEIDTARTPPVHEFPTGASRIETLLGRKARTLPAADSPAVMAWVVGRGLSPHGCYVLEVEFPDDVPRTIFIANRGADLVRGFATGKATGDARQQFVQPSLESLDYPQSGTWQSYRSLFFLHERYQDLYAQRDPAPGGRPRTPADGFHVIVFQSRLLNDPRSAGAAIGKIRLRRVPDPAALYPQADPLPPKLSQRRIFYREEMADESIAGKAAEDRACADPVDWYAHKAQLNRLLGINTFTKDLLEFGFNQGWDGGDQNWYMNSQPPNERTWERLLPRVAAEGLAVLPYYEYKGALGLESASPRSLGWQRRAQKLYHGRPNETYSDVWWTEPHNADLTDPDTLADACRLLDRTVLEQQKQAQFLGAWFRTRDNCLPISFSDATILRFQTDLAKDADARAATHDALVESYESDRALYNKYVDWWLGRRVQFFEALRAHLAAGLDKPEAVLLFTPWTTEQVPMLRSPDAAWATPVQIASDDPAWWNDFARQQSDTSWFRWALAPTPWDDVVRGNYYRRSLSYREPIAAAPSRVELFHSAPSADPAHYGDVRSMLTFPAGRLFAASDAALLGEYRSVGGLVTIRHSALNEDNHDRTRGSSNLPFDGQVGYTSVDVDRAGPHGLLSEARLIAAGDPWMLGSLYASSFSTGFPGELRRFYSAFTSVPALPSRIVPQPADSTGVVVREIRTPQHGLYYLVVNTSMKAQAATVRFPVDGALRDLLQRHEVQSKKLAPAGGAASAMEIRLQLDSGELRSFRVLPSEST